jgi:hypothetical protein
MRQFQDDLNALNALARERSNQDLIISISNENPQIREIQAENRQLKTSIEEHQRAIELIMTKYRQHTQQQIQETRLDFERLAKAEGNNVSAVNLLSPRFHQLFFDTVHKHHQCASREAPGGDCCHATSNPRLGRLQSIRRTIDAAENRKSGTARAAWNCKEHEFSAGGTREEGNRDSDRGPVIFSFNCFLILCFTSNPC